MKSSPLGLLISDLHDKFPEMELDELDRAFIESKCSQSAAEGIMEAKISSIKHHPRHRSDSVADWQSRACIVESSRPECEIKVYRLVGGQPRD